jgi:hypothetical protein
MARFLDDVVRYLYDLLEGAGIGIALAFVLERPLLRWILYGFGAAGTVYWIIDVAPAAARRVSLWLQPGPIQWTFDGFLRGDRSELGAMAIGNFQANGTVRRRGRINACYVQSHADGTRSHALLSTDTGHLKPAELGTLEPGASIRAQASFAGEEPTIPEAEFHKKWPGFMFVVEYENARLIRHFTPQEIKDCIDTPAPQTKAKAA